MDLKGLFQNPALIRQKRLEDLMQQRQAISGMGGSMSGLLGQVAAGGSVLGQQMAEAIGQGMGLKTAEEVAAERNIEQANLIQSADNLTRLKAVRKRIMDTPNANPVLLEQVNKRIEAEEQAISARADKAYERSRDEERFALEKEKVGQQAKNLDLQGRRLSNLIERDEQNARVTEEERQLAVAGRNAYADSLEELGTPLAARLAKAVRNGNMTVSDAESRLDDTDDDNDLTSADRKAIRAASAAGRTAEIQAGQALDLAQRYLKEQPKGGFLGSTYGAFKKFVGGEDEISLLRTDTSRLVNSGIIASLPQGPATDRDIEIFSRGFPDANSNADYIAEWMSAYARIKIREADYERARAKYMAENRGVDSGFDAFFKENYVDRFAGESLDQPSEEPVEEGVVEFSDVKSSATGQMSRSR